MEQKLPPSGESPHIPLVAPDRNPWRVPLLDVRPITWTMLSITKDPVCAKNAVSFRSDDGRSFIGLKPASSRSTATSLRYPVEDYLADGVLFTPECMEHKWAIFLHRASIIFVRSWRRRVRVVAKIDRKSDAALVTHIDGQFTDESENPDFTVRVADYLIRSHAMNIPHPAPLRDGFDRDPKAAALWCMSTFGKMAQYATSHPVDGPPLQKPLRTNSMLHISVARNDSASVIALLNAGVPADLLAKDGHTPLHWALSIKSFDIARLLLRNGCPVDARSDEQATPLMSAIQARSAEWTDFLLSNGADANARDARGFTSLHRAAEMGEVGLVRRLLAAGVLVNAHAGGHTPLSLAQQRNQADVVEILSRS